MFLNNFQVVLQEVPGEVSLCFSISGCQLRCQGCHSPYLWKEGNGVLLSKDWFVSTLKAYKNLATCILFMGGEWHENKLISYLKIANSENYKTCLYTGETDVSNCIKEQLTWLKTGKWDQDRGGLNSKYTNQKFIEIESNTNLNHLFIKN